MIKILNFPSFDFRIEKLDGKLMIFDVLRKKSVILTPEEWVRQHMIRYLMEYRNYPRSLIRIESGLKYDKLQKRSDILVYDKRGEPFLVIECKSPETTIGKNVLQQVSAYSRSLKVKYIGVSNGLVHFCWAIDHKEKTTENLEDFPIYN
jgi:type I site-specific restriction endonuclease